MSTVFDFSIYNSNVPILAKMRGQSASHDVAFSRYGIFPPFPAILATFQLKMADLEGDIEV